MKRLALLFGLVPLLWQSVSVAQNYRELPIGGRTATMGGAGTAAGNDSAMPYLNPAGMAGVPGDIFAVSATVYSYTRRAFQDYFFPSGTEPTLGYELERESFATSSVGELPSSVMYFNHLSAPDAKVHHHAGIALVIPSARRIELVASVEGRLANVAGSSIDTSALNAQYRRYYLGPSYALGLADRLRLGISGFLVLQRGILTDNQSSSISILGGTAGTTFSSQVTQLTEAWSFVPVAGLQVRAVSDLWLGLGLAVPALPITGRMRFNSESTGVGADPNSGAPVASTYTSSGDVSFQHVDPFRINVGVAFDRRDSWSLAADLQYYLDREISKTEGVQTFESRRSGEITRRFGTNISSTRRAEPVLDFSIGGEVAMSKLFALRAGFYSDLAAVPELEGRDEDVGRLRLDRYGGTLGLGVKVGSFDTTAGVVLARGTGEYGAADTWITGDIVPIEASETTVMLVLSGAVTVEEAKRQIRDTVPFDTRLLPDFGPSGPGQPKVPRIPLPLPPEPKPEPPLLNQPAAPPALPPAAPPAVPPVSPASPPEPPPPLPAPPAPPAGESVPAGQP